MAFPHNTVVRSAWLLACVMSASAPGHAAPFPTPAAVKARALSVQAQCIKRAVRSIKTDGDNCGNSGCSRIIQGCYLEGEVVVNDAIQDIVKKSDGHVSGSCQEALETLANAADNNGPWLEDIMGQLPVDLAGDPIILQRVYFYELAYRTVRSRDCKR